MGERRDARAGVRAGRLGALGGSAVAVALLLAGCDQADTVAGCKVDVTTEKLQQQRIAAGVPDCEPGEGEAELPEVALPCLGGTTDAALADIEGPAVVNFWSTTCGPCIKEMPALEEFHQEYGERVAVVGVNFLDTYPEAAIDLERRSGTTYPSLADACGALQETDLVVGSLPQFLFIRADGSVEQKAGGVESVAELVELAEESLGVELDREPA